MQICYGELDWPDEYSKRRFLRDEFLKAVAEYKPGVCEALYGEPLVLFGKLEGHDQTIDWEHFEMAADPTSGGALIDSLRKWSRDWWLDADWCREAAFDSLGRYYGGAPSDSISTNEFHHRFDLPTRGDLDMTLPPPAGLEEYWPLFISRDEYLEQVSDQAMAEIHSVELLRLGESSHRRAFVKTIVAAAGEYCVKVENHLKKQGYVRPKVGEKRNLTEHLEWAVLYQVAELGWSRIAESTGVQASAVQKAVTELLKLIDLPQRPISRGRPHGSKDSTSTSVLRKLGR